jgi:tetratricopeptide (TPR) repeat protein
MRGALSRFFVATLFSAGAFCLFMSYPAPLARADDRATALELAGLDLYQHGDVNGAIEKFRQALALKPNDRGIHTNLAQFLNSAGVAQYESKDYAGATAKFQEAVSLAPSFQKARTNLGMAQAALLNIDGSALYKAGNFDAAADKFRQALAADSTNASARVNLDLAETEILTKNKDYAGAVAKLQDALSVTPSSVMIQTRLAVAQASLLEAQKAAEEAKAKEGKPK